MERGTHFAATSNAFGFELYRLLARGAGNRVFSPASVSTAMAMTWAGARGETSAQMATALRLAGPPDVVAAAAGQLSRAAVKDAEPSLLRIANRLFGDSRYSFETAFLELSAAAFAAPLEPVDFADAPAARARINRWVEEQTNDRIRDLLPSTAIDPDTRLVLVNAVYLLGKWLDPFVVATTKQEMFATSRSEKKPVPTMHRTDDIGFARADGLSAIELLYEGGQLSMIVVLPERVDGVDALERSLTVESFDELVASLERARVAVALPRFEVSPPGIGLRQLFEELGLSLPFDRARADFTGIADPPDPDDRLFVGEVFHKAFVRTDEAGTEAAAATAVSMARGGGRPPQPIPFTADHPFLFFVVHRPSGLIMFMGRVSDPASA